MYVSPNNNWQKRVTISTHSPPPSPNTPKNKTKLLFFWKIRSTYLNRCYNKYSPACLQANLYFSGTLQRSLHAVGCDEEQVDHCVPRVITNLPKLTQLTVILTVQHKTRVHFLFLFFCANPLFKVADWQVNETMINPIWVIGAGVSGRAVWLALRRTPAPITETG